jgi:hypothetical protein
MVFSFSFRGYWLLALLAFSLLITTAAAQDPAGAGPAMPSPEGPTAAAPPGGNQPALGPGGAAGVTPVPAAAGQPAAADTRLAKFGPAQPDEHPLMPALRWAYDGVGNIEKLQDYSATMVKRERVNGKVGEPEYMFVKIRHQPFSVYMYFLGPADLKGREVIYVRGRNSDKLLAHATGLQGKLLGTLELEPTSMIAMRGNRYPLTEIGILNMVRRLVEVGEQDIKYGECEVKFFKGAKIKSGDGYRVCTCIQVVHPVPRRNFLFHLARIFVDEELNVPVRYESYDWPEQPGGPPRLLEEYTYLNLKLNNGFTDTDFDPRSYPGFPK